MKVANLVTIFFAIVKNLSLPISTFRFTSQCLKRALDPTALLGQLPSELKYTLTRNFGFFTTIFTQFFDRDGARNVQKSIGLGK
jgi:hypothetical protein